MNKNIKSRHGCLTAFLILLIITSVLTASALILFSDKIKETAPNFSNGLLYIQLFSTILELTSIYLIFKWKKIGFYGVALAYLINLYVSDKMGIMNINTILGIIIRFGLLYGTLQIKSKGISGWKNLTE